MSGFENRLDLFRGQIEELQGKMQQALGQLEGPRGIPTVLAGRGLEMKGKARQTMAQARIGAADFSRSVQEHPEMYTPYIGLFAFGLTVVSLAVFFPRVLSQVWDWIRGPVTQMANEASNVASESGFGTGYRSGTSTGPSGMGTGMRTGETGTRP